MVDFTKKYLVRVKCLSTQWVVNIFFHDDLDSVTYENMYVAERYLNSLNCKFIASTVNVLLNVVYISTS